MSWAKKRSYFGVSVVWWCGEVLVSLGVNLRICMEILIKGAAEQPRKKSHHQEFLSKLEIVRDIAKIKETGMDLELPARPAADYVSVKVTDPVTGDQLVGYRHIPGTGSWRYIDELGVWVDKSGGVPPSGGLIAL